MAVAAIFKIKSMRMSEKLKNYPIITVDEVKEKHRPVYKGERTAVKEYKCQTNKLDTELAVQQCGDTSKPVCICTWILSIWRGPWITDRIWAVHYIDYEVVNYEHATIPSKLKS